MSCPGWSVVKTFCPSAFSFTVLVVLGYLKVDVGIQEGPSYFFEGLGHIDLVDLPMSFEDVQCLVKFIA